MKKMMMRIASIVLAMSIVLSLALVSVSATSGNLIDSIPSDVDINSGEVGCSVSGNIVTLTANSAVGTSNDWGMQGFEINEKFISNLQDGHSPVFAEETKVLISAKVRKAADATADAKINVSYASWYNVAYENGTPKYTDTYPNVGDGFLVNSTDWMKFKAYITIPAGSGGNTWAYLFGLSNGTAQGAKVEVDMTSMYFGPEVEINPEDLIDYTPADSGNVVDKYPEYYVDINAGEVPCSVSGNTVKLAPNSTVPANGDWGLCGFHVNQRFISSIPQENNYAPEFTQGTKVLFSAKVRKASDATADAKINVALSSWYFVAYENGTPLFADMYPSVTDGFLVDSTEWTDFKAVITVPRNCGGNTWNMTIGLAKDTVAGANVEIDMSSIYFGTESAYDIEVSSVGEKTFKAEIVNQIGEKFSGTQGDFEWYAMNGDRTAFVDGITITDNGNGEAVVSASDSVAGGTYNIVASSDTYEGFVGSAEIKIQNFKNDYTPADSGNVVDKYPEYSVDINSGEVPCSVSGNTVKLAPDSAVPANGDWGLCGFHVNQRFISSIPQENNYAPEFTQGTKVLFSAKVRKASDATADAKINVALSSWYFVAYENGTPLFADMYPSVTDGFLVDSTEWTDFKAVITVPRNCGGNTWNMTIGLAKDTVAGANVEIDMSSIYFGTESVYDIEVSADAEKAEAKIVNQIGLPYSGTQGGFEWYAMNADRTAMVDGITVTDNGDGTASISVADTVAEGTYSIVAVSDTYEGFISGVEFVVEPKISGITLSENAGYVTVATDTALVDVKLIFVSYETNGKMVDYEEVIVNLDAQKTGEYAPVDLTAGSYTKAMLWYDLTNCTPLANAIKY